MQAICEWAGISRQGYYQSHRRHLHQRQAEQLVIELVQQMRQRHPCLGTRKLLHELSPKWIELGVKMGRDRLFQLLRVHELLVDVPRSSYPRTTRAGRKRFPNLMTDLLLTHPYQAWVCDITYIATESHFLYLSLITDAFSRYIVGYDLAVEGALRAVQQAISRAERPLKGVIHHSDHGSQYSSHPYQNCLEGHGLLASMGEVGNAYDNAKAERVNGILKLEYRLDQRFVNAEDAAFCTGEAIWLYNHERPHLALNYAKPAEIHYNYVNNRKYVLSTYFRT